MKQDNHNSPESRSILSGTIQLSVQVMEVGLGSNFAHCALFIEKRTSTVTLKQIGVACQASLLLLLQQSNSRENKILHSAEVKKLNFLTFIRFHERSL